ncbi:unnamed protein product [Nippostrongylus brasiliensis]|uniref:Secreted protein n=1 Tax=Nippostrongylus brasiliensis TaxID=27835 RepID=A0A0N4XFZ1_NIPBR|nr:unnamed protein product [Nippostrongylus brasiliensis]
MNIVLVAPVGSPSASAVETPRLDTESTTATEALICLSRTHALRSEISLGDVFTHSLGTRTDRALKDLPAIHSREGFSWSNPNWVFEENCSFSLNA